MQIEKSGSFQGESNTYRCCSPVQMLLSDIDKLFYRRRILNVNGTDQVPSEGKMNNKKLTTLFIVSMIAIASVFAAATPGQVSKAKNSNVNNTSASTQLNLTVLPENIESYTFGFSSTNDALSPSVTEGITLTMQDNYTAKNETAYLFYDVRSDRGFTLTLTSSGALDNGEGAEANKKIDYTVKIGDETDAIKTAEAEKNLTWTKSISKGDARYNTYSIDVATDPIPASGADTYTSTLELKLTIV